MVMMNSDKAGFRRKPDPASSANIIHPINEGAIALQQKSISDESPNFLLYKKMEKIIEQMQDENTGVPVRTVKSFMSKIPSVFTGSDLILWMTKNLDLEDQQEALHFAHLIAAHGYFFPIEDHMLTVRNDGTFYRFQTPYFWPSNCWEPENTDYAVYLCKRTMQNKTRLELADYEAENLARLQKMFSRKWEFIFMQAEAQSKVDKKRDKLERKVLDSQERAFWDVHRPMPGCVNTTEIDIKKACQMNKPNRAMKNKQNNPAKILFSLSGSQPKNSSEQLKKQITVLKTQLERRNIKVSKAAETFISYYEQYLEYDPFFVQPEYLNPWIFDSTELWEQDKMSKEVSARRVKRWAFSLQELIADPIGREHFEKFLDKEFSGENLKFWEAVQELKCLPQSQVQQKVSDIWDYYLASDAKCPINVDSHSYELTKKCMENPDRWSFDNAAAHVYQLMKSDSYSRYLRSEMYKDFLNGSRKKTSVKGIRSIVSFSARKDNAT
ncbi:regulator of G-protein signaling 7 [Anthonomus grandis grandis]|uniref:regulator of G-protein signaling 7 n=1 Tax=Anthonomus grandis grandis TaxID=2921223 RepID=UPI0021651A94|nr:regulator of G-protein signaling 7 [Anthonomus grandis grandis]XP_050314336.1 regulator of G-protein signaling 7 [Anthonomus grandis grandis]XP_050314337.1 regulator of G-protein signaling 7 [Anthonomus grandis grandis]XP_050314338.1 regulator of G-protein signaling 7 [Anthonomus grandis grandis]